MEKLRKAGIMLCIFAVLLSLCACKQNVEESDEWVGTRLFNTGAISDDGYYYLDGMNLLHYVDFRTGTSVCLCSKAGCPHETATYGFEVADCDALLEWDQFGTMFTWEDGLFYSKNDGYGRYLYRRNADGTGESKVGTLCEKYIEEDPEVIVSVYGLIPAGHYVYYYAAIDSVTETEDHTFVQQQKLRGLLRMDLRTGEEEILYEDYGKTELILVAARNDSAIYTVRSFPDVENDAENYSELLAKCPVQLLQWNADTGESEIILEKTRAELVSVNCLDGKFYTVSDDGTYIIDLETGELALDERRTVETGSLRWINWDYAFWRDPDTGRYHLKDLNTGELLPTEIDDGVPSISCASNEYLVISNKVVMDDGTKDGIYMYVKIDDLSDGIQEKDVHEFYAKQYASYSG